MSDWAVGDLAVCVDVGAIDRCSCGLTHRAQYGLTEGHTYTVDGVQSGSGYVCRHPHLIIAGHPRLHVRFLKVAPDKHEACETEFVTLLQRIKRKQVA